jgi:succinate dehydrogenase / fumarate reductase cytochrome b subunit
MLQRLGAFLRSSIGRKFVMALTGAALALFVLIHLIGNLTLFADAEGLAFNAYAHTLESSPLLPLAEIGLAAVFVLHIYLGIRGVLENREARPARYKDLAPHGNRTLASTSMIVTGLLVGAFLVIHLIDFRLAPRDAEGLASMVVVRLSKPIGALIYLIGVIALGVHLWHAFQSLFQSLGISHPRYRPLIVRAGWAFAVLIALGFAAFPVAIFASKGSFGRPSAPSAQVEGAPGTAPAAAPAEEPHGGAR